MRRSIRSLRLLCILVFAALLCSACPNIYVSTPEEEGVLPSTDDPADAQGAEVSGPTEPVVPDAGPTDPDTVVDPVTCGPGTALNEETNTCEALEEPVTCGPGTVLNEETNECEDAFEPSDELQTCPPGYVPILAAEGLIVCEPILPVTVFGFLTNSLTGAPVEGASVSIWPGGDEVMTTDAMGYFSIEDVSLVGEVKVVAQVSGYLSSSISLEIPLVSGAEGTVLTVDASMTVNPVITSSGDAPNESAIAGTVYAGANPAAGAVLNVYADHPLYQDVASAIAGPDGSFVISGIPNMFNTSLRVDPYDADGDGGSDYQYYELYLGKLDENDLNLGNLVVVLQKTQAHLSYVNFTPPLLNVSGGTLTGHVLQGAGTDIVLHFGSEMDTASLQMVLVALVDGVFDGAVNVSESWNSSGTVLTVNPSGDLNDDVDPSTTYELRIQGLSWSDGDTFVDPAEGPGGWLRLGFDVPGEVILPGTPSPAPDFSGFSDSLQAVTAMECDSRVCWLVDEDGAPYNGYQSTESTNSQDAFFNGDSGFDLSWQAIPGAVDYKLYVHQSYTGPAESPVVGWQPLEAELSLGFLGGDTITAKNVLSSQWSSSPHWEDLGVGFLGDATGNPLLFGNEVQIAVTAVDGLGNESMINPSSALTLTDETPSRLTGANQFYGNEPPMEELTEKGFFEVEKSITAHFSEWMDDSVDPEWSVYSGNIESFSRIVTRQ